ncbi:DDE-type integrase/transposase/recombinase [Micromonospora citrea]|uniref:DDE-type integrase/transposase/recombinase n=1 Tax=Micromonospora citrea TaxID=47855 RepID=UPI003CCC0529
MQQLDDSAAHHAAPATNTHMRTSLVIDALDAAVAARGGRVEDVIFHSDRGAQYGSGASADACRRHGVPARRTTTPWPRRSSPPSSVNSTSAADGGQPRPTPAATCGSQTYAQRACRTSLTRLNLPGWTVSTRDGQALYPTATTPSRVNSCCRTVRH